MRPPIEVVLASANPHKAVEIEAILGGRITVLPRPAGLGEVDETEPTLEGNARLKARAVAAATGRPALADDTGLEIDALGGAPGVITARWAGEGCSYADNVAKALSELHGVPIQDRGATFATVALVAWPDGRELVARGEVRGHIATEARGESGFGYDPVFVPADGDGSTFSEMGEAAKHRISHRARAMLAMADLLEAARTA